MDGWCEVLLGGQTPILSLNGVKALKDKNNPTMQKNTIYNKKYTYGDQRTAANLIKMILI